MYTCTYCKFLYHWHVTRTLFYNAIFNLWFTLVIFVNQFLSDLLLKYATGIKLKILTLLAVNF